MKALLEKIRNILRSRKNRQVLARSVSVVAAVVVFITTYALVLPAITMEQNAPCGIEEHQHTDGCYEERLVCGIPEGQGHHHDASCYEKILVCEREVHIHSPECYQQDGMAVSFADGGEAVSTASGAAGQSDVLYGTDGSDYDPDALVTDGSTAGEEGMEGSASGEAVSGQPSAEESDVDKTAPEGSGAEGADAEEGAAGAAAHEGLEESEGAEGPEGAEEFESGEAVSGENVPGGSGSETASENVSADETVTAPAGDTSGEAASEDAAAAASTAASTASDQGTAATEQELKGAEDASFKSGTLTAEGDGYKITLEYTEKAEIPENAELSVREITAETDREAYEACLEQAGQQVAADEKTSVDRKASRFFDIEILERNTDSEGNEVIRKIEPSAPVSVNIQIIDDQAVENDTSSADQKTGLSEPTVLHFAEEGVEQLDAEVKEGQVQEQEGDKDKKSTGKVSEPAGTATEFSFEAESFSIYAVVYTVDFHWEVDGKEYEFSIPGGGFVSLEHLVEMLGIGTSDANTENGIEDAEISAENAADNTLEDTAANSKSGEDAQIPAGSTAAYDEAIRLNEEKVSETAKKFVADVVSVEFSSPELVWTGKADEESTVGGLKEANGLEVEYGADLTKKQTAEINAQTVDAGDWAVISVQPFTSEETLTVTMKDGEVFTIRVTDAQISTHVITADGKDYIITVTYDESAQIPEGAELKAVEITDADEHFDDYMQRALAEIERSDDAGTSDEEGAGEGYANDEDAEVEAVEEDDGEDQEPGDIPESEANIWSAEQVSGQAGPAYTRFFDIEIQADGRKVEPKASVSVQISLADVPEDARSDLQVVHFGEDGDELMTVETSRDSGENTAELSFVTDGFSVYAIASQGDGTNENIFKKEYVLVHNNVALSPEPNPANSNHLRGISVNINGDKISTSESALPVWKLERYWDSSNQQWRFLLSTIVDGSRMYLHLENRSGGSASVSATPQPLLLDTQNNDHYECRFRVAEFPNAALDLDNNYIANGFHAYVNGSNVYFRLYELGEEIFNKVTVHFVDRKGNPIPATVTYNGDYSSQVTAKGDNTFEIRYDWKSQDEAIVNLKDDFTASGYTYASSHLAGTRTGETELKEGGLTIDEKLHSTGSSLEYYSDRGVNDRRNGLGNMGYLTPITYDFNNELRVFDSSGNDTAYSSAGVDKDVYVILDSTTSSTGSGSSSGSGTGGSSGTGGDTQDVEDPNFHKQLDKNPDGTYTLSLSVTGHAKNTAERPKANILLVVDTSSSMTGQTSTGTRLSDTKAELRELGGHLLDKNRPEETDPSVELAMISFDGGVTDELDWVHVKSDFTNCVDSNSHLVTHQGTDWEDGLKRALEIANDKKDEEPDQPVFIVFFTDGEPSQYTNFHGRATNNNGYAHWYSYYLSREAANDEMRAIVQAGHRLYGVYAFNNYVIDWEHPNPPYHNEKGNDLLHHAIQYGYNTTADLEGSYYHYASNKEDLNKAFTSILRSINQIVGFDDVVMNDSITSLTSVGATNEGSNAHGFTYTRSGGKYGEGQEWVGAPQVTYTEESGNELGKITWDLSNCEDLPNGLEDGVTYTVSFTVWPSQEAFDYVTKLNNGFITMDDIPEAARSCFFKNETTGKYEVRTNPESGPDPDNNNEVTNRIDYVKNQSDVVSEKPEGASTDPDNPDVVTSQEGDWPQVRTETWYEHNDDDTWTKHVTTTVVTAFGPPDKNMVLDDSIFKAQKEWQVSREEEMIYFLYDATTGLPVEDHKYLRFNVQEVDDPDHPNDFARVDMGYDETLGDYRWADSTHPVIVHDIPHQVGRIWEKNLDISYGQMISPEFANLRHLYLGDPRYIPIYTSEAARQSETVSYYVLETGHDYKIAEPALDYRFEFQTEVYHPMLVNGTPSNVKITYHEDRDGRYGILEESEADSVLKGRNILRGDLKMRKVIIGPDGEQVSDSDAVFDFKVTLTNNDDPGPFEDDPHNPDQHNIPWYGVKVNGEGEYLYYHKTEPNADGSYEYTDELHACVGGNYLNGLLPGYDGNRMNQDEETPRNVVWADIRIQATDVWNITNIPSGTAYQIEESVTKGYEFVDAVEVDSNPPIRVESPEDPVISGAIGLNTTKEVVFKNEQRLEFEITKVDVLDLDNEDADPLAGAAFKLEKYTNDTFRFVDATWGNHGSKTAAETAENPGRFYFEGLKEGYYKLIETAWPDGYVKQKTDPMIQVVFNRDSGKFEMKLLVYNDNGELVEAGNNRDENVKIETIQRPVQTDTGDGGDSGTGDEGDGGTGGANDGGSGNAGDSGSGNEGDGGSGSGSDSGSGEETEPVMENVLMFTYGNIPGAELPNSGGPGTRIFTIFGTILIAGAGMLLLKRRRTIN